MYSQNRAKILIGPIIGKVTENSARILLEIDSTETITINIAEIRDNIDRNLVASNGNTIIQNNFQNNGIQIEMNNQIKQPNQFSTNNYYNQEQFSQQFKPQQNFANNDSSQSQTQVLYPRTPTIFKFEGLRPNQRYSVSIQNPVEYSNPELQNLESSFRTIKWEQTNSKNMHFAFMSCNSFKWQTKHNISNTDQNLWKNLSTRINEIDYCIHMGDQVYADDGAWEGEDDNCYTECRNLWKDKEREVYGEVKNEIIDDENKRADLSYNIVNPMKDNQFESIKSTILRPWMMERISDEYRKTWNMKYTAYVMRNIPNIMIIDDHEIYDDFGWDDPEYFEISSFRKFFAEVARICYYRYQKLLWEDIDFFNLSKVEREHHFHIIGGIGLFFQDFRGCRSWLFNKETDTHTLGYKQYEDVKNCFSSGGFFDSSQCRAVIYIAASPIVFFSKSIAEVAATNVNDALEQWSLQGNDQVQILQLFNNFRERTGKNVVILSGDVHVGLYTSIYCHSEFILEQMTTSPIFQRPPTGMQSSGLQFLLDTDQRLAEDYSFSHTGQIATFNFGIVEFRESLSSDDRKITEMFGKHVYSSPNEPVKETEYRNIGYRIESRGCVNNCGSCNII
jgi:hypothetical protein